MEFECLGDGGEVFFTVYHFNFMYVYVFVSYTCTYDTERNRNPVLSKSDQKPHQFPDHM